MTYVGGGELSAVLRRAATQPGLAVGPMKGMTIVDGTTTEGRYSLYRIELAPHAGGASPHFHRTFAESFHVLTGVIELYDGLQWTDGCAGDHLFIPERGIHGFRNSSGEPASMLMMTVPAAPRETYFAELANVVASGRQPSAEEWTDLFARHDQYMV